MIKSSLIVALISMHVMQAAWGQSYNFPESVVFDYTYGNYYISNANGQEILKLDAGGTLSIFVGPGANLIIPRGLCIFGDSLFVTDVNNVRSFDLNSGNPGPAIMVNGSANLNDIAVDYSGEYLYVSDNLVNKIFRITLSTHAASEFVSSGLNAPNGIYYDASIPRLIIVEYASANSTIKSVLISNPVPFYLVTSTANKLDGIARDAQGYWYVSSWATNKIYRYDHTFLGNPVEINTLSATLSGPADIFCNTSVNPNILAVPSMENSQVYFIPLVNTGLTEIQPAKPSLESLQYSPNGRELVINNVPQSLPVSIHLFDVTGREVAVLFDGVLEPGENKISVRIADHNIGGGFYFLVLKAEKFSLSRKITLN